MTNLKQYKYDWIWQKPTTTGFQHAKNMPLKNFELLSVFSKGSMGHKNLLEERRMTYNPQGIVRIDKINKSGKNKFGSIVGKRPSHKEEYLTEFSNYPKMILEYSKDGNLHPTQKPVSLLEYIVNTYTNKDETVLDFCAGAFSTGVAAINTGRKFIGIEKEKKYFDLGVSRILGPFVNATT